MTSASSFASLSPSETSAVYRFGTSGYRNDSDAGFNEAVVRQLSNAIADYLIQQQHAEGKAKPVLVGGDTREKTQMALPVVVSVFLERGLEVYQAEGEVATPILAYAAAYFNDVVSGAGASCGAVLLTASHNPWAYGGYNFLTPDGAVAPSEVSKAFEALQQKPLNLKLDRAALGLPETNVLKTFNAYQGYKLHLEKALGFNWQSLQKGSPKVFYDPLFATGRLVFPKLLTEAGVAITAINTEAKPPAGYTGMPEPSPENLTELAALVKNANHPQGLAMGFSNDGDADRFGVLDENGGFLHPNTVMSLILYHLVEHRGKKQGLVIRSQATSHQLDRLTERFGLSIKQTPVGYKYIAETFIEVGLDKVVLGGESSGGLSIGNHIPEKDGLLANLLILELVTHTGKPLTQLITELESLLGQAFVFREWSIHTEAKQELLNWILSLAETPDATLGPLKIDQQRTANEAEALKSHYGTRDGVKLYTEGGHWLLLRVSGTEPIVRIYWESTAATHAEAVALSNKVDAALRETLQSKFSLSEADIQVRT